MSNETKLESHAIDIVTKLAQEAAEIDIIEIDTAELGEGLPLRVPVYFDAKSQTVKSLKAAVEEFRLTPRRRSGTAHVSTLKSFIDLTNRHRDERSALFAVTAMPKPSLTAVIDYDEAKSAARSKAHRIAYEFPLTEEFKAWTGADGKAMDQEVFAAFLEEHCAELAAPSDGEVSLYEQLFKEKMATPSEVVALSRHLEVFVAAKAKQGIRLQSGERQVEFTEEHQNAKGEAVVIPGVFMVSVPAFIDGDAVRIPARLRYRLTGGVIKWFYQLYRWEFFLREQVGHDLQEAVEKTGLPGFEGAPEA